MKKLFLALLAFVAMSASAQTKSVGEITWFPQFSLGYVHGSEMKSGNIDFGDWAEASIGFGGKYQVSEKFGISAAATFAGMASTEEKLAGVKASIKASYIEVPILASIDLSRNFGIQVGLKPSFKTSFELHLEDDGTKVDKKVEGMKGVVLYLPVGATYQFNSPLSLGFHYNFPLTKINKEEGSNKFHQFLLTLAYDI